MITIALQAVFKTAGHALFSCALINNRPLHFWNHPYIYEVQVFFACLYILATTLRTVIIRTLVLIIRE